MSNQPAIDTSEIKIDETEMESFDRLLSVELPSHCIKKIKERLAEGGVEQTDDQLAALLLQICTEEAINRSERDPLWGVQMKSGTKPAMPTDGEPFTAQFALDLSPVFTWPDFSSIDLKRPTMTIDDETVQREFHNQRLAAGESTATNETAAPDDEVIVEITVLDPDSRDEILTMSDMCGRLGMPGEEIALNGTLFPGFDRAIRDRSKGETSEIECPVPTGILQGRLGAKNYPIRIEIKELLRTTPATVQEVLDEYGTPNEEILLMQIRTSLQKRFEFNQKLFMTNQLMETIASQIEYTPPKRVVNRMVRDRAQALGKSIIDSGGSNEEAEKAVNDAQDSIRDQAAFFLKRKAISSMLQKSVNAQMTEIDLQDHIAQLAALHGKRPEELRKELMDSDQLVGVSGQVIEAKIFKKLESQLTFTDIDARDIT